MNKHVHIVLLLMIALMAPGILMSQDAGVVYLEGWPSLRSGGSSRELDFGLAVRPGDSVLTGRRDYVELDQGGNTIRINADTVFTLREIERGGRRETVMTNTVGSVAYRFQTLAGRRQQVGTTTAVAGVRGTEFTVYAGSDGTSLFGVDSGLISVESEGISVNVSAGEAVQVPPGEAPGEVVRWIGPELDFQSWNQARIEEFLQKPIESTRRLQRRMQEFIANGEAMYELYLESRAELDAIREQEREVRDRDGADARAAFFQEFVVPVQRRTLVHVLNYRYYDVSALSLRRFVYSRIYVSMKARYWREPNHPVYREFVALYHEMLEEYENGIAWRLDREDI